MPETGSKSSGRLQYELLDETLDLNNTKFQHLSIQVSLDGFLFAIIDPEQNKCLCIKRYQFDKVNSPNLQYDKIAEILKHDPFLQRSYQGVSCIINETRSTLLPAALFDRDQLKLYFQFNHVLNELDELHYNYLKQADAYLVFPVYSEIADLCLKQWLNTAFYHQSTPLIDTIISLENPGHAIAGINFNEDHFDVVVAENKKLLYYNNFSFRSEEDFLYFILFVFDKLGLDQETTPIFISGEIDKFSETPELIRRYFKKISFLRAPTNLSYPASFQKIQDHSLLNLLKIFQCG